MNGWVGQNRLNIFEKRSCWIHITQTQDAQWVVVRGRKGDDVVVGTVLGVVLCLRVGRARMILIPRWQR